MSSQKYEPLERASSDCSKGDLPEYDEGPRWIEQQSSSARAWKIVYALCVLLTISLASNGLLLLKLRTTQGHVDAQSFGKIHGSPNSWSSWLTESWQSVWREISPCQSPTMTGPSTTLCGMLPSMTGMRDGVALDDDFVKAKGVPTSMRWPWDSSKSIYVFHSFHSLHCVVSRQKNKIKNEIKN